MKIRNVLLTSAAAVAMSSAMTATAFAQETTGAIRGVVTDTNGAPASGVTVIVTNVNTGATRTLTTSEGGDFYAGNLNVGGSYNVYIQSDQFQNEVVEGIGINLGETTQLNFDLEAPGATDVIVVTGTAISAPVAIGPTATFGLDDLQTLPAINRNLNDIVRTDPRIYVDESFVGAIQCAGRNPRFNSLTVDGIRQNDGFGLNSNGYPTQEQPFSFDAIEQVAVELAPFDVQYGGFSACNINAVTKSGTNEFHGSFFYDYTDDNLEGDSLEGDDIVIAPFEEKRYGATFGGPIIKDHLFFFLSYEKREGADNFDNGYEGSGAANEIPGFTQAEFDRIKSISQTLYNYDPGDLFLGAPSEDEKILVKLDWNINENHRASFVYNWNDGFSITGSDDDPDEFEFSKHFYERGAELNSYVGSLFSNWTDNFSTELRVGKLELDNRQISQGLEDGFGEFVIEDGPNSIYLGADDSRHANKLSYEIFNIVAKGTYLWNDHAFTFGYEREEFDIFNLFAPHSLGGGAWLFDSIDDFEAGRPSRIEYNNAPSLDPTDAAAAFAYAVNTIYAQDEFELFPGFDLTVGARYDWYTSDDVPAPNPDFAADYGYSNSLNIDGEGVFQPRIGFQWDALENLELRGGVGIYSGGNPNVWISNNFSNSNVLQFEQDQRASRAEGAFAEFFSKSAFDPSIQYIGGSGPGYGAPSAWVEQVQLGNGGNFEINALDPNFEIPTELKFALGSTYYYDMPFDNFMGGEYVITADLLYSTSDNQAAISRGDLEPATPAVNGLYPQFTSPRLDSFILTNSDATVENFNLGLSVSKQWENVDLTIGYAFSDAEDVQPMTSSIAFSNYNNRAFVNPEADEVSTSNYEIRQRWTFQANYRKAFWEDFETKVSLFGFVTEGQPYSFTLDSQPFGFTPFVSDNTFLLYVPTGPNDPNVNFGPNFDQASFFRFLDDRDLTQYAGGFVPRNSEDGSWWTKFDLKLEQEFPGILDGHKSSAFLILDNVGNFLNDDWGVLRQAGFPGNRPVVDQGNFFGGDTFNYNEFIADTARSPESRVGSPSRWSIRVGLSYEF